MEDDGSISLILLKQMEVQKETQVVKQKELKTMEKKIISTETNTSMKQENKKENLETKLNSEDNQQNGDDDDLTPGPLYLSAENQAGFLLTKQEFKEEFELSATNYTPKVLVEKSDETRFEDVTKNVDRLEDESSGLQCKCGKIFKNSKWFDSHVTKVHVISNKIVVCTKCGVELKKSEMNKHNNVKHMRRVNCKYEDCVFSATCKQLVRNHVNRIHLKLPLTKDFVCKECGKGFNMGYQLTTHVKVFHLGQKIHECEVCGKTFGRNNHLYAHREVHSAVDKYVCKVCGKGFRHHGAHWNHAKLHMRGDEELRHQAPRKRRYEVVGVKEEEELQSSTQNE